MMGAFNTRFVYDLYAFNYQISGLAILHNAASHIVVERLDYTLAVGEILQAIIGRELIFNLTDHDIKRSATARDPDKHRHIYLALVGVADMHIN